MYSYIKAIHIIFVVTWFSGIFYIVRLFIYNAEANEKPEPEKTILLNQFRLMTRRLWYGITWPSAILTLIFGSWMYILYVGDLHHMPPQWLVVKLLCVFGLYSYHLSLHLIFKEQMAGIFRYSSNVLRIWNEVATIFLVVIVMRVVVRENVSFYTALLGFVLLVVALMSGFYIYKLVRTRNPVK